MGADICIPKRDDSGTRFSFTLSIAAEDRQKRVENLQYLTVLLSEYRVDVREVYRSLLRFLRQDRRN